MDVIILIFVLSALHPHEWQGAVGNIHKMLKPGGLVLLRDYGRHDLTQLRFKGGRLLDENFYIRGDKTRVYFFELDELALLFTGSQAPSSSKISNRVTVVEEDDEDSGRTSGQRSASLLPSSSSGPSSPQPLEPEVDVQIHEDGAATPSLSSQIHTCLRSILTSEDTMPLFAIEQLGVDRRLIVNRKRQLKMYRVWMQAKFRKLPS